VALKQLASQGTTLHYTHQNIAELWNAMTRHRARGETWPGWPCHKV
jgi:hypothetical protein